MWIEIFRTGKHRASCGKEDYYSEASLDEIAARYNSAGDKAPLVKGHPKNDDAAYGWVERLARRGTRLLAKVKDVAPELADQVRKGMYRKVSIALFPDKTLRHVGLLGAVPPAVKGLAPVQFSGEREYAEIETECFTGTSLHERNAELEEQVAELSGKLDLMQKEQRVKEFRAFADSLVDSPDGMKLTPGQARELVDMLEMAWEADNARDEPRYVDSIKRFAKGLVPVADMKEFATAPYEDAEIKHNFDTEHTDGRRLELHNKANALVEQNPGLSYEEAVIMISKGG